MEGQVEIAATTAKFAVQLSRCHSPRHSFAILNVHSHLSMLLGWLRHSVLVVGVLEECDSVEHARNDEGEDYEGNELASQRTLFLLDLLHLVVCALVVVHLLLFQLFFNIFII